MAFRFHLFLLLIVILSFLIGLSVTQFLLSKEKSITLKQSVKLKSFSQINHLNQKIETLKEQAIKRSALPDRPDIIVSQPLKTKPSNQIPKSVLLSAFEETAFHQDPEEENTITLPDHPKLQTQLGLLKEHLPDRLFTDQSHFIKTQDNQFLMIFYSKLENNIIAVFLKKNFFKERQKTKAFSFITLNKNQDFFFYNHKKSALHKPLPISFTNPKPKFFTIQSNKKSLRSLYYIQTLNKTNLMLLTQKTEPFSSFYSLFLKNLIIYLLALILMLGVVLWLLFNKVMSLTDSYLFLKKAFVSFAETGSFPLWETKNPLLFFYKNRKMILKQSEEEQQNDKSAHQLQSVIKEELKKLQARFPQLSIKEDYQTDVKMFGFERFLRTILSELFANALESMGSLKDQKIDISIKEDKNCILLSIRDYGTGIKDTKKAFQIYHSTKSQLGVGLNLVQSIATANGGSVTLENIKEGAGTKAEIRLPLSCFIKNI